MGFETIENYKATAAPKMPPAGVRVTSRGAGLRDGKKVRFISIAIGAALAKKLVLTGERIGVALAFGNGRDAGKIRISVDAAGGGFSARRNKRGNYVLTISAATAAGLFALDFPPFAVPEVEVVHETNRPPAAIFAASAPMLAVED